MISKTRYVDQYVQFVEHQFLADIAEYEYVILTRDI
jgi:hypothetical protein